MAKCRCGYLRERGTQCAGRVRGSARSCIDTRDFDGREVAKLVLNSTLLRQQEQ